MKTILVINILLINFFYFAQDLNQSNKISITPFAQYGTSYYKIKGQNLTYGESPLDTYGYGVRVSYNIKKIAITSGLEYQQFGEQAKFEGLTFGDQIDPALGFTSPSDEDINAVTFKYKYNYIAIPIIIELDNKFEWGAKNKIHFSLFTGVKANFFASSSKTVLTEQVNENQSKEKSDYIFDNRTTCISSVYGLLFHKKIGEKINLKIGPTFDLFHQATTNTTITQRIPYKGSIFGGITF